MNQFEKFLQLHNGAAPLLLGNCWDVSSAKLLEENGFKAIATSSAAVARSLGYEDGEKLPFDLLLETVKRMRRHITVPFSVDMEKGYSDTAAGIIENIRQLYDSGVAGINIEDSRNRKLEPAAAFAKNLSAIANHLAQKNMPFFINARTDAFVVNFPNALHETLERVKLYQNSGASGIFVPFIKEETDISSIVASTTLPVNVLVVPGLPGIAKLASFGVRRISLGSGLFNAYKRDTVHTIKKLLEQQSFDALF
jgi:2-methylisocitrate lyase-like PEP mutase family enzyme